MSIAFTRLKVAATATSDEPSDSGVLGGVKQDTPLSALAGCDLMMEKLDFGTTAGLSILGAEEEGIMAIGWAATGTKFVPEGVVII